MKRFLTPLALIAVLAMVGCAGDSGDTATEAVKVGAELTLSVSTPLAELVADPAAFVGKTLRLEGTVVGVCKGSGCWVQLDDGAGNLFYAKSLDHSIGFPTDCEGRTAVVEGIIISDPASGHDHKHEHEHEHEHEEGEADHKCPEPPFLMDIMGGILR